ncbi:MAG: transcriptional repressor LexA [Planctomycetota bacterium]|nr:transcriptional repressor LexA [Planctomycetota bacterium]
MNYTPKQLQILRMIHQYQQEHGYSPTYAELAKELHVSTITVFEHLEALERKGAIKRRRHEARSVEITEPSFLQHQQTRRALPVKGLIAAGAPIEAIVTEPAEELPIGDVFNCKPNSYVLRVKGDSMVDDHILDGDMIVVESRETAHDGEIVVALDDNGQATLKRIYHEGGKIRLQPANAAMPPIVVDHCRIQGVLKGLVRKVK